MENLFSDDGLSLAYFAVISVLFVLTLAVFFDRRVYEKSRWTHRLLFALLVLWCVLALAFKPFATKLFGAAMLLSAVAVEIIVRRQRGAKNS